MSRTSGRQRGGPSALARSLAQIAPLKPDGSAAAYLGVYDGHGGTAAAEWLRDNLRAGVSAALEAAPAGAQARERAMTRAFLDADKTLLAPTGFMNMGARGVGGPKCGSAAAVAVVYQVRDGLLRAPAGTHNCMHALKRALLQL